MSNTDCPPAVASEPEARTLRSKTALADCEIETTWRRLAPERGPFPIETIRTARWKSGPVSEPIAHSSLNTDLFVAAVVLAPGRTELRVDGHITHDGAVAPGLTQITAPMQETFAQSAHPCDVFHLFIPPTLIDQALDGRSTPGTHLIGRTPQSDPVLINAVSSWIDIQSECGDDRSLYAECLALLVLHRITHSHLQHVRGRPSVGALQPWRLRRAIDYVEANLERSVTLKDMAAAAGLSAMHFAAQFRLAMGTTPYRYVLRRRIERAQYFMRQNSYKLVEVATMTGFSSQAHFSSAFRSTTGITPRRWRESIIELPKPCDPEMFEEATYPSQDGSSSPSMGESA